MGAREIPSVVQVTDAAGEVPWVPLGSFRIETDGSAMRAGTSDADACLAD